jgi:hypothetical protein
MSTPPSIASKNRRASRETGRPDILRRPDPRLECARAPLPDVCRRAVGSHAYSRYPNCPELGCRPRRRIDAMPAAKMRSTAHRQARQLSGGKLDHHHGADLQIVVSGKAGTPRCEACHRAAEAKATALRVSCSAPGRSPRQGRLRTAAESKFRKIWSLRPSRSGTTETCFDPHLFEKPRQSAEAPESYQAPDVGATTLGHRT